MIEMNTSEEISEIPNTKNDFTPEATEAIIQIIGMLVRPLSK